MRTAYAFGLAAFLAVSPAMAQVIIGGGNNDATGNYGAAAREHATPVTIGGRPSTSSTTPTATAAGA